LSSIKFSVKPFYPKEATETMFVKFFEFKERENQEINPKDPLPSRKILKNNILDPINNWGIFDVAKYWTILLDKGDNDISNNDWIGFPQIKTTSKTSPEYESNKHIAEFFISIDKTYRHQGIGTYILKILIKEAEKKHCSVLQSYTKILEGHKFCIKFGAIKALDFAQNRLQIKDIDWSKLQQWIEQGPLRAPGVTLERFEEVSEEDIVQYCGVYTESMNLQPFGELDGIIIVTPKARRLTEAGIKKNGEIWVTLISREISGVISGFTEMTYNPEEPIFFDQWLTAVSPKFRGRGIGKWLKAEMLHFMVERFPKGKIVVTGNADSNAPMRSINKRMGFKKHQTGSDYKFTLDKLNKRLEENKLATAIH